MDIVSRAARSENMRRIGSKNSNPEKLLRKLLFAQGYRYRLHVRNLPGKPDLVFPGRRKVIFVNGCFWHRHGPCPDSRLPKTNLDYWLPKLRRNMERDIDHARSLRRLGWDVLTVWDCELKPPYSVLQAVVEFLEGQPAET